MKKYKVTHTLLIDTDSYVGNFERELFAYTFGLFGSDEEPSYLDEIQELALRQLGPDAASRLEALCEYRSREHDGFLYPSRIDIYPTPGFWNDGNGKHFPESRKPKPGQKKYPAYQSLGIFVVRHPRLEDMKIIKQRAKDFSKLSWGKITEGRVNWIEKIRIRGFRMMDTVTNTFTHRV